MMSVCRLGYCPLDHPGLVMDALESGSKEGRVKHICGFADPLPSMQIPQATL